MSNLTPVEAGPVRYGVPVGNHSDEEMQLLHMVSFLMFDLDDHTNPGARITDLAKIRVLQYALSRLQEQESEARR